MDFRNDIKLTLSVLNTRKTPDFYFIAFLLFSILWGSILRRDIFYPYVLVGIILIIIGMSMVILANLILQKKNTSVHPFQRPSVLITSGVFKISRNPIYLGMTIILLGIETILGSWPLFILPFLFAHMLNRNIIPAEEDSLQRTFGQEYRSYKTKVRRWI